MKKILVLLLSVIFIITGCEYVNYDSVNTIIDSVLYRDTKLSNVSLEGYDFYLPQGTKIVDKYDYNLTIKDNNNYYYLYVDTIAYYYKTKNELDIDDSHFYASELNRKDYFGFVDIDDLGDKYFIVIMYNYAKIESYVSKDKFNDAFANMCNILASVKFNDKVIDSYIDSDKIISQVEEFDIFSSKNEEDNFLKYEKAYDTYDNKSEKDEDHININGD